MGRGFPIICSLFYACRASGKPTAARLMAFVVPRKLSPPPAAPAPRALPRLARVCRHMASTGSLCPAARRLTSLARSCRTTSARSRTPPAAKDEWRSRS